MSVVSDSSRVGQAGYVPDGGFQSSAGNVPSANAIDPTEAAAVATLGSSPSVNAARFADQPTPVEYLWNEFISASTVVDFLDGRAQIFSNLLPEYVKDKENILRVQNRSGIHSWNELLNFIEYAARHSSENRFVFRLKDYQFHDTLLPPENIITALENLSLSGKTFYLEIDEGVNLPAPVYQFLEGKKSILSPTAVSWPNTALNELKGRLRRNREVFLALALQEVSDQYPEANRNDFLRKVIEKYNHKVHGTTYKPIRENQLTEIFSRLQTLKNFIESSVMDSHVHIHLKDFFSNPLDVLLSKHPSVNAPAIYSIGAGQMIASLEFPRHLMDIGALPLDTQLIADDGGIHTIFEINVTGGGTNGRFGDKKVNPSDRAHFRVYHKDVRLEKMEAASPMRIILNLKAKDILNAFSAPDFLKYLKDHPEVQIDFPSKANLEEHRGYTGLLPYIELLETLELEAGSDIADSLIVDGGFFGGPWILNHEEVDMVVAGGSQTALERLAHTMTPTEIGETGRADWDKILRLKLIADRLVAVSLNQGGADKNYLTARSAYLLTQMALNRLAHVTTDQDENNLLRDLNTQLDKEKKQNISLSDEIRARYFSAYPSRIEGRKYYVDHLWAAKGLKKDFISCLPTDCRKLIEYIKSYKDLFTFQDGNIIEFNLKGFEELTKEIRSGKVGGTRNAADGVLRYLIRDAYNHLQRHGLTKISYEAFFKEYHAGFLQEGAAGLPLLLKYFDQLNIPVLPEVIEASNVYTPDARTEVVDGQILSPISQGAKAWDLPVEDVVTVLDTLNNIELNIVTKNLKNARITDRFMAAGFKQLIEAIENLVRHSVSSEATWFQKDIRRIINDIILPRLKNIKTIFKRNNIPDDDRAAAIVEFTRTIQLMRHAFQNNKNTAEQLLIDLREAARQLYYSELCLSGKKKFQLEDKNGQAEKLGGKPSLPAGRAALLLSSSKSHLSSYGLVLPQKMGPGLSPLAAQILSQIPGNFLGVEALTVGAYGHTPSGASHHRKGVLPYAPTGISKPNRLPLGSAARLIRRR